MHCSYAMFVAMLVIKHFEQRCYILPDGPSGFVVLFLSSNIRHKFTQTILNLAFQIAPHVSVVINQIQVTNTIRLTQSFSAVYQMFTRNSTNEYFSMCG